MKNLDYKNENIGNEYKRVMHSKSNNIKFTSDHDANKVAPQDIKTT